MTTTPPSYAQRISKADLESLGGESQTPRHCSESVPVWLSEFAPAKATARQRFFRRRAKRPHGPQGPW